MSDRDCTLRSRPYVSPMVQYVSVFKVAAGGAVVNQLVQLPIEAKWIMVVGCPAAHLTDTLFLHFDPTTSPSVIAANAIVDDGLQKWLPLFSQVAGQSKVGIGYHFKRGMPLNVYLDIGQEAGGGNYNIMLAVGEDVADFWRLSQ